MISASKSQMKGIIPFAESPLLSTMFLTAVGVYLIEKDYLRAFWWTLRCGNPLRIPLQQVRERRYQKGLDSIFAMWNPPA